MIEHINAITYRGSLKSCNYSCSYCPFAKRKQSIEEIELDKENLQSFYNKIHDISFREPISILFAPYGEALIHDYYKDIIIKLSQKSFIKRIGIQTNLSLDEKSFLEDLINKKAVLEKIVLWATFHPEMANANEFSQKVFILSNKINLSVGAVGNPAEKEKIKILREKLPPNIYMWVNKMDGLKRKYTEAEINFFTQIDSLFGWELKKYVNQNCECLKKHLFVNAKGDLFACNRNSKNLGNMYNLYEDNNYLECNGKKCDCYLSYSHLEDFKKGSFLKDEHLMRVPKRVKVDVLFLDVDGTLLDEEGKISNKVKNALTYISKKIPIYLATELPYEIALKKCKTICNLLSGGCFAGGAHCLEIKSGHEEYEYINVLKKHLKNDKYIKVYEHKGSIYKVMMLKNALQKYEHLLDFSQLDKIGYGMGKIGLVKKGVSKISGIEKICKVIEKKNIMCIGNSILDLEMIKKADYGVAVPSADDLIKQFAGYILNVWELPYIL